MSRNSGISNFVLAVLLVVFLAFTLACNSGSKSLSTAPQAGGNNSNQIIGAGSTFIYPIMSRWIADFRALTLVFRLITNPLGAVAAFNN